MRKLTILLLGTLLSTLHVHAGEVAQEPDAIHPILIGQTWPDMTLKTPGGMDFDVNDAMAKQPTVIIVYRGGWCPYCNTHLGQLRTAEGELIAMGYQVFAISPDRPAKLAEALEKDAFTYQLLSDSDMAGSKALGIAFQVPEELVMKYKNEYGIDLEADSGHTHHQLPVPSVFIVGSDGVIDFSYVNPNYKVRLAPEVLLAAARAALDE